MSKLRYLNAATSVLKWAVLYPIDPENSFVKKLFYFFWALFFISSLVIMIVQCVVELAIQPFSLEEENFLIMNTVVYVTILMNFIIFSYNGRRMVNLVYNINKNFVEETDNGIETVGMGFSKKITEKMPIYWTISLISSALFLSMQPLMAGTSGMPVPGWFPFDYTKSPFYEISYFWQLVCQFNLGIIYGGSDMIYPSITVIIGQQFKILASNLKNSFYYAICQCGVPKEIVDEFRKSLENKDLFLLLERYTSIFQITNRNEFHQININYFKKNLKHHQLLLTYCEDLNQIMRLFLLTKVIAAFFNVTFIAFSLITTGDYSKIMGLCSYVFFASTELFVYTYAGQILTENADFLWSLYEAPWYLCDLKFQRLFLVTQMRVGKMIFTKAGNYFPMCAPMLITFLRSIFSYVALLKELVSNEKMDQ